MIFLGGRTYRVPKGFAESIKTYICPKPDTLPPGPPVDLHLALRSFIDAFNDVGMSMSRT